VEGVVAQEDPQQLGDFETGSSSKGYVARVPTTVSLETLDRGEERYNIYCAACHDRAGTAQGIVPQRGFAGPIDLSLPNTRGLADGQIFAVITDGIRTMPAMKEQIPVSDRWPIVAFVRVLQRSQYARIADVEPQLRGTVLPEEVEP
jgi:mono/diheme cytochrome c family protein